MLWTAPREMAKEKLFHRMWQENEKLKLEIKELQVDLEIENEKVLQMQRNHQKNLTNHGEMLDKLKERNYYQINQIMYLILFNIKILTFHFIQLL